MRKETKIISALILSFFASFILGNSVFSNFTPRLNPQFVAVLPETFSRIASAITGNSGQGLAETCTDPTGTETYNQTVSLGPHMTNNISPQNYLQVRRLYNCEAGSDAVKTSYIPTQVVYDLFFTKGSVTGIKNNLLEMKKYGLYPIIRVASYTDGSHNWIKVGNEDARIMGQHLAQALNEVGGFPVKPLVTFGNEVNLHTEWGGQVNAQEFAGAFASFMDGMGQGNFEILFPALSYGANGSNGIAPAEFINSFFASTAMTNKKLTGATLNIYGTNHESIQTQFVTQKAPFDSKASFFTQPPKYIIGEIGPTNGASIIYDCSLSGPWPPGAAPVLNGFIANPVAPFATTACFSSGKTELVIAHYNNTDPRLIDFEKYGSIPNDGSEPTATPNPNEPTATPNPSQPTATPNPNQPTATPGPNPTNPPNPTAPPQNTPGTLEIRVHVDTEDGPLFSDNEGSVQVYIEGPSSNGHRFGEAMDVFGKAKSGCTSTGGFPYTCQAGIVLWKGADGRSGTSPGDYTASILGAPDGWEIELKDAAGSLSANGTLTLDLVIKSEE